MARSRKPARPVAPLPAREWASLDEAFDRVKLWVETVELTRRTLRRDLVERRYVLLAMAQRHGLSSTRHGGSRSRSARRYRSTTLRTAVVWKERPRAGTGRPEREGSSSCAASSSISSTQAAPRLRRFYRRRHQLRHRASKRTTRHRAVNPDLRLSTIGSWSLRAS
jgi:hypothetical protein